MEICNISAVPVCINLFYIKAFKYDKWGVGGEYSSGFGTEFFGSDFKNPCYACYNGFKFFCDERGYREIVKKLDAKSWKQKGKDVSI